MFKLPALPKIRWQQAAAFVVVLVIAVLAVQFQRGRAVPAAKVHRRDFVQTVVASGHVQTPHRVDVGSQITSTVVRVPVDEGASVRAGDLLVELSAAETSAAARQAEIAVAQARGKLRQLSEVQAPVAEQALRQARINLANAQSALRRNQALFDQGFIGAAALDDARKAAELADAQVQLTLRQWESTRAQGSDIALAQGAVTEAEAALQVAQARERYTSIRAPADGVLISRKVEAGDVVQPGKVLMTLSPHGRTQILIAVDEKNLQLIQPGQKALVSADAYPQQRFDAVLSYINPGVNAQTGSVDVKLDVAGPPSYLRQDMTVSVDIEVARRPQALLVPATALHEVTGSPPWVWRITDGRAEKVAVQVGLRSAGMVEITQGLSDGDLLISGNTQTQSGDRVRPQAGSAQD
jgi:HlyD family secretion protein